MNSSSSILVRALPCKNHHGRPTCCFDVVPRDFEGWREVIVEFSRRSTSVPLAETKSERVVLLTFHERLFHDSVRLAIPLSKSLRGREVYIEVTSNFHRVLATSDEDATSGVRRHNEGFLYRLPKPRVTRDEIIIDVRPYIVGHRSKDGAPYLDLPLGIRMLSGVSTSLTIEALPGDDRNKYVTTVLVNPQETEVVVSIGAICLLDMFGVILTSSAKLSFDIPSSSIAYACKSFLTYRFYLEKDACLKVLPKCEIPRVKFIERRGRVESSILPSVGVPTPNLVDGKLPPTSADRLDLAHVATQAAERLNEEHARFVASLRRTLIGELSKFGRDGLLHITFNIDNSQRRPHESTISPLLAEIDSAGGIATQLDVNDDVWKVTLTHRP